MKNFEAPSQYIEIAEKGDSNDVSAAPSMVSDPLVLTTIR
tara:strand:+ start:331 stop:450 length:120 start_codon:yes stop_codon:yes gene_type:complete